MKGFSVLIGIILVSALGGIIWCNTYFLMPKESEITNAMRSVKNPQVIIVGYDELPNGSRWKITRNGDYSLYVFDDKERADKFMMTIDAAPE